MKTKKDNLRKEVETVNDKFTELSDDALDNIIGGLGFTVDNKSIQKEMDQSIAQIDDNVLKQTAQSTVAQANHLPQGILDLLQ